MTKIVQYFFIYKQLLISLLYNFTTLQPCKDYTKYFWTFREYHGLCFDKCGGSGSDRRNLFWQNHTGTLLKIRHFKRSRIVLAVKDLF